MEVSQRRAAVDRRRSSLSVASQCKLLDINRSGLYYQPIGVSDKDLNLMKLIDRQYMATPFYGTRKMAVWRMSFCKSTFEAVTKPKAKAAVNMARSSIATNTSIKVNPLSFRNIPSLCNLGSLIFNIVSHLQRVCYYRPLTNSFLILK